MTKLNPNLRIMQIKDGSLIHLNEKLITNKIK